MKLTYAVEQEGIHMLKAKGCCAWNGSNRCGKKLHENSIAFGAIDLIFQTYACIYPVDIGVGSPVSIAFFCEGHLKEPWKDMSPDVRKRQLKEQEKFRAKAKAEGAWGYTN